MVHNFINMATLLIELKDDKALKILESLKEINLISFSHQANAIYEKLLQLKPKNLSENESFFELKGLWKDRNITLEQIRDKAWPKRK